MTLDSVVLVAGLGGDPVGTWQANDKRKTLWPTTLLQKHIGNLHVRILTFRYTCTLQGAASPASIRDHANVLLQLLANDREDSDERKLRPIVFVGHSLGGIIIKQVPTILPSRTLSLVLTESLDHHVCLPEAKVQAFMGGQSWDSVY
jgi:hypothetical protein